MTAVLQVSGLCKRYGRTHAVDDVSFTVSRGDVFGLLGPNGSGKTTTINCALGLLRADKGQVSILGEPASAIHRTDGRVGVIFDSPTLVDGLTCEQNLRYARRTLGHDGGRSDEDAMRLVGIGGLADRRAGRLSLGQRRRLSIARALIGHPELLILDEPLSGLDTVGVRGMLGLFQRLSGEGLTLVVSSHRLHEMETLVTNVGIMVSGKLVVESKLDTLLEGRTPRLRLVAKPASRVDQVLVTMSDLERFERVSEDELLIQLGRTPPAELNRALVEAGCEVSALVPERRTLLAAFEELVDGVAVPP
ncbi:MAG: ABC transporter ATP-binding protein [Planctomycetota bacterium]|jgi:ABC-2 type transport system ATP-binding protein